MKTEKSNAEIVVYENKKEAADKRKRCSFNELCEDLQTDNICIKRYVMEEDPEQFKQNKDLWCLICRAGIDTLPATYVNGKIVKIEEYPTKKEVDSWISDAI